MNRNTVTYVHWRRNFSLIDSHLKTGKFQLIGCGKKKTSVVRRRIAEVRGRCKLAAINKCQPKCATTSFFQQHLSSIMHAQRIGAHRCQRTHFKWTDGGMNSERSRHRAIVILASSFSLYCTLNWEYFWYSPCMWCEYFNIRIASRRKQSHTKRWTVNLKCSELTLEAVGWSRKRGKS